MKESSGQIKNKLKKFFYLKRMNPHIYWINLLYAFLFVVVGLILFSLYLLSEIKNQQIFQITPNSANKPTIMDDKLFDKMIETFNKKIVKQKEIENGFFEYKDPSLK
jgi:hypothetical protein